ncbi:MULTISPECIES: DUF6233 domain-containing protein [unclassified Streptomyces]|uniref:DUF6233 domain-containing protein n=1 Tax=unclassified Streptomyces TaxID=2593676 RepID=UPI002E2A53E1|nr:MULTISPECIES: DUF6233 domain-containing protein [unclassified Streptomyces]
MNSPELLPLPPRLGQLLVIRRWLELTLERVDARIETVRETEAALAQRRPLPEPAAWWLEYGRGVQQAPTRVHTSACPQVSRSRPATRQSALETLRTVPDAIACPLCRPDRDLGLLDQ